MRKSGFGLNERGGGRGFSLPVNVKDQQVRLVFSVYIGNEHRGKAATLQVMYGYRVWQDMEKDVANSGKKFLCCHYVWTGDTT